MSKTSNILHDVSRQVDLAKAYEAFVQVMIGSMADSKVKPETVDYVANRLRELLVKYGDKVLEPFALMSELHLAYAQIHMLQGIVELSIQNSQGGR